MKTIAETDGHATSDSSTDGKIEILVIEDDEQYAEIVVNAITEGLGDRAGCRAATTLAEAVHLHRPGQTDLFILDLMLPDNTGIDGLRNLRALDPEVAIIVLTAREDPEVAVAALREGAQDFLGKSDVDPSTLPLTIKKALARMDRTRSLIDEISMLRARLAAPDVATVREEPLSSSSPELFQRLVESYIDLLQLSTGPSAGGAIDDLSAGVERLAADLAGARVGPKDITEIHTLAVRHHSKDLAVERAAEATAEGQILLIRMLGLTLRHYREQLLDEGTGHGR